MKKIILTILTIISMQLIAQDEKSTIKIYSPDEIVKTDNKGDEDPNSYKWTVKTDLLSMLIGGEFPLIYEHRITDKISVEGSLGMTYSLTKSIFKFDDDEGNNKTDTKPSTGSAFRGGFKYYPSSDWDAIEGWSFGVQAFKVTQNSTYSEEVLSSSMNFDGFKESNVKKGLAVTIAKQFFWDSNICYEYMLAIGFAKTTNDFLTKKTNYTTQDYEYKKEHDVNEAPSIKFGLRIGFGN